MKLDASLNGLINNIVASEQERRSAKFECTVSAEPSAEMTWFKGTRELGPGEKYEIGVEHDRDVPGSSRHFLVVNDCFRKDSDEYCARASNRAGSRSSRAQLIIKCKKLDFQNVILIMNYA